MNVASLLQSRMSIGNEFQADGAETAKALSVNRRPVRGVLKSLIIDIWQGSVVRFTKKTSYSLVKASRPAFSVLTVSSGY